MSFEAKWFETPTCICVLTMDPVASGVSWSDVSSMLNAGESLPSTVRVDTYGATPEGQTKESYVEDCKRESLLLAESEAARTVAPTSVLLLD